MKYATISLANSGLRSGRTTSVWRYNATAVQADSKTAISAGTCWVRAHRELWLQGRPGWNRMMPIHPLPLPPAIAIASPAEISSYAVWLRERAAATLSAYGLTRRHKPVVRS